MRILCVATPLVPNVLTSLIAGYN